MSAAHHHNDSDALYFVERIQGASKRDIARLLLTIPDAIVGSHGEQLRGACRYEHFPEGANYLIMRATAFDAVRTAEGELPRGARVPLERWRAAMVEFSRSVAA